MLTETELKTSLQSFAENDFCASEADNVSALIPSMLEHIGSTDSELRDDLIYSAFNIWILRYNLIAPERLHELALEAISNRHIFYHIGDEESDSVFRRTFSMLLLPLVLIAHRERPFLSKAEIVQIKESLLRYTHEEKDRRGFVPVKGWAHSVAHCADALDDVAHCTELGENDLREILAAVAPIVCRKDAVYTCGEEERLSTVILAVLSRGLLPDAELAQWISNFTDAVKPVLKSHERMVLRSNIKNFLQSLYFRIQWEFGEHSILTPIERSLFMISPYTKKENG